MQGSEFRAQGSEFRVQVARFRVHSSGFRAQSLGFRVQGSGFRVPGSGYRVQGFHICQPPDVANLPAWVGHARGMKENFLGGQPTSPNPLYQRDDLVDRPRTMGV